MSDRVLAWLVILAVLAGMVVAGNDDRRVAELQELNDCVAATYNRPAAYRLASPSLDEMEHLEHVRRLNSGRGIGQVTEFRP